MDPLDVLGLSLDDALKKLDKLGIAPVITETFDFRKKNTAEEGVFRVVKQRQKNDRLEIITCKIPDSFR